ncbi:MAG: hypothetical protein OHK0028_22410 [Deltaproteobacteria bacterium]
MKRPLLFTVLFSLLALFFGWETRQALREPAGGQDNAAAPTGLWQPGAPVPDPVPPADPGPLAAAVAARPLFRPDRQPFREQSAAATAARNYESELSRFTLLGVLGFGGEPVGVVTGKTGSKADRWELKAGDALPGFTVKEVGMEGLRLTADGREFLLPLYAGAPAGAGAAVRTETGRRDAAHPAAAPGVPAAAKPAAPAARPAAAAPPAPAPAAPPRTPPAYTTPPYRTPPGVSPRFVPGRR